ncbi:MAG: hypothetical protein LUG12_06670 [Erysipelotrichaceae bacterium]|nr:hypothetical protein [Erysipelotrichaceae bacterium]
MMNKEYVINEYAIVALAFSFLSLITAVLSILNAIPIIIAYQFLQDAKEHGLSIKCDRFISSLLEFDILLTICISLLYLSLQV